MIRTVLLLVIGTWGVVSGLYRALTYRSPWGPRHGWRHLDDEEIEKLKDRKTWRVGR